MIQGMELRHLQTFVIAVEMQSFTRAANVLGVTQAAVSQHIAALEKELRVSLFKRSSRSVVSTEPGRTLYECARRIVDLAEEAQERVTRQPKTLRGTLKIAASTVPSEWLLPELLAGFRRIYPDVRQFVSVSDSASAIRAVDSGEVELGIVGELPRAAKLWAKAIASDQLTLVVPPEHPFASAEEVTIEEFRSEPLIVREPDSGSRRCVEQALSKAGLAANEWNITMEVNSNEAIRAAVERGVGVAFLSMQAVSRDIRDGRLVSVRIEAVHAERSLYLVTDPERMPTRPARSFLDFVETQQRNASKLEDTAP